jgi:phage I-like protein
LETVDTEHGAEQVAALGDVARAQICARLEAARELAGGDLAGQVAELRELLNDVIDRADALETVYSATAGGASCRSTLSRREILATDERGPRTEFLLIPFGQVRVERPQAGGDFVFTQEHAAAAVRWFERMGRKLAIDYEHQSFEQFNRRPDGLRPAAGWIGGLEIRPGGLWAVDVTWTDRARELLSSGEYRYFSPVIFWADEDYTTLAALGPVALTNDPAMCGVRPLAAAQRLDESDGADEQPDEGRLLDATAEQVVEQMLRTDLEAARAEVAVLRGRLQAQAADAFVERGMRLGKIVDATSMDWRADYLRDAEGAEEKLARAAVVLPPGRLVALNQQGTVAALNAFEGRCARDAEAYRRWGIGPEDLRAYERAVADGRVRRVGAPG